MVEYKTYNTARFHIPDGMYTIKQVEEILVTMKEMKRQHDEYLKSSMRPSEEKTHDQA
jgi:hypothetical protein